MVSSVRPVPRLAALAIATGLLVALPAVPSFAATSPVTTIGALQAALADCSTAPLTVVLGAAISAPATGLTVTCDTTLDLSSFDLSVSNVVVTSGKTFTVDGPTDGTGGTLRADARNVSGRAGITNSGATVTVKGGTVVARGALTAPGIGGDRFEGSNAGTLNVAGGTVSASSSSYAAAVGGAYPAASGGTVNVTAGALNATAQGPYSVAIGGSGGGASGPGGAGANVTVTGGVLTATANSTYGTAIGGGIAGLGDTDRAGAGGSLTIGTGGEVRAVSPRNAFGSGWNVSTDRLNGDFGSLTVDGILRLPSGRLWVGGDPAAGPEVTVGSTGRILGSTSDPAIGAEVDGPGIIDNQGSITLAPKGTVTGNNTLVRFTPTAPSVRVFAPSFGAGARTLPTPPTGTMWNTAADGSGSWFTSTSSTAGAGILDLSAIAPATIAVSTDPAKLTATAGVAYVFPVSVNGPNGAALSPQPAVTYSSTNCTIGTGGVFTVAGSCDVTATTTVQRVPLQKTFTIHVAPGALTEFAITPATGTVVQGASIAFVTTGKDADGNAVDTNSAVLTSSAAADTVTGRSIAFSGAGAHTVTATLGSLSATAAITVVAGPLNSLSITPSSQTVTQGETVGFTVAGTDAAGNPVDASAAVLTSNVATDTVSNGSVRFSGAGSRFVTATLDGVSTTASIEVVAGPLASLTLAPATTSVSQGDTKVFVVTGADAAGNPVPSDAAILTSSAATDVVDGRAVTFSGAGTRTVTASLLGITATAAVDVVAGPLATLSLTPPTASLVQGGVQDFVVTGADTAGNAVDTSAAVLTSSSVADKVAGRSVTFSGAGSHRLTATQGTVSTTATVSVAAGPLAVLTVTPSAPTVAQGGTLSFGVTAQDAAGNPVDATGVVLSSSVATDVVTGTSVTFPHASPHAITATLGGVTASVVIQVVPTPAPAPGPDHGDATSSAGLAKTGSDGDAAGLTSMGAVALVVAGGLMVLTRRRRSRI